MVSLFFHKMGAPIFVQNMGAPFFENMMVSYKFGFFNVVLWHQDTLIYAWNSSTGMYCQSRGCGYTAYLKFQADRVYKFIRFLLFFKKISAPFLKIRNHINLDFVDMAALQ